MTQRDFLASIQRLTAAGLIEGFEHDSTTASGVMRFTPAYHKLLMAGRNPFGERAFLAIWRTGDPKAVRKWVEEQAATVLRDDVTRNAGE